MEVKLPALLGMTDWPTDRPGHREASLSMNKKVMIYIHGWGMLNDVIS